MALQKEVSIPPTLLDKELKTLGLQVYPDLRIPLIVKRLTEALIELEGTAVPVSLFVEGTLTGPW